LGCTNYRDPRGDGISNPGWGKWAWLKGGEAAVVVGGGVLLEAMEISQIALTWNITMFCLDVLYINRFSVPNVIY